MTTTLKIQCTYFDCNHCLANFDCTNTYHILYIARVRCSRFRILNCRIMINLPQPQPTAIVARKVEIFSCFLLQQLQTQSINYFEDGITSLERKDKTSKGILRVASTYGVSTTKYNLRLNHVAHTL